MSEFELKGRLKLRILLILGFGDTGISFEATRAGNHKIPQSRNPTIGSRYSFLAIKLPVNIKKSFYSFYLPG
jgi:hypothetical protein